MPSSSRPRYNEFSMPAIFRCFIANLTARFPARLRAGRTHFPAQPHARMLWTGRTLTFISPVWRAEATFAQAGVEQSHEMVLPDFHLVAWSDLEHGCLHLAVREVRRRGRIWQPLLPFAQNRQGAWRRAPVGHFFGRERRIDAAAWLVRLAPSHSCHASDAGKIHPARVARALRAEFHRHAAGLASARLDLGGRHAASGDRRLRGLDSGWLRRGPLPVWRAANTKSRCEQLCSCRTVRA